MRKASFVYPGIPFPGAVIPRTYKTIVSLAAAAPSVQANYNVSNPLENSKIV